MVAQLVETILALDVPMTASVGVTLGGAFIYLGLRLLRKRKVVLTVSTAPQVSPVRHTKKKRSKKPHKKKRK